MTAATLTAASATLDLATATLDELGAAAVQENNSFELSLSTALAHFVRLGEILNVARDHLDGGGWFAWCETKGISKTAATRSMRLAHYRDQIPDDLFKPRVTALGLRNPSMERALAYVRGLPDIRKSGGRAPQVSQEVKDEAIRLVREGRPYAEIARLLGTSDNSVRDWTDPVGAKKRRARDEARRRTQRAALKAQREAEERKRLAKVSGKELSLAYEQLRRMLATLDKAIAAMEPGDTRRSMKAAYDAATTAESHLVEAMHANT